MNAKDEMLLLISKKPILCAIVEHEFDWRQPRRAITLKVGHTPKDLNQFLKDLDFNYDSGYGIQRLFGTVWFTDGTWAERGEYDGSEWWNHLKRPQIPNELNQKPNHEKI